MLLSSHLYLPFCWKSVISRVPSLHEHYLTSQLLHTHPSSAHLRFFSCSAVMESTLLPGISPGDETDFSSCLVWPCYRAATISPPKCLTVSVSFQLVMLSSPYGRWFDLGDLKLSRLPLCSLPLRPDNSHLSLR